MAVISNGRNRVVPAETHFWLKPRLWTMYSGSLTLAVFSSSIFQIAISFPFEASYARRQNSITSGLRLLGPEASCFDLSFARNTFSATCLSSEVKIVRDVVDLDQCISNDDGSMRYSFQ